MNEIKYLLAEVEWSVFLIIIISGLVAFQYLTNNFDWFNKRFGFKSRKAREREKESNMIVEHEAKIAELDKKFKDLLDMDKTIKDKINVISQMILESEKKSDAAARARLKDRIGQAYRYYHERGSWNRMERDAFKDLIEDYEAHGGENSFVHEICEKEYPTWKLID